MLVAPAAAAADDDDDQVLTNNVEPFATLSSIFGSGRLGFHNTFLTAHILVRFASTSSCIHIIINDKSIMNNIFTNTNSTSNLKLL